LSEGTGRAESPDLGFMLVGRETVVLEFLDLGGNNVLLHYFYIDFVVEVNDVLFLVRFAVYRH
jgi:hypothetical protein